MAEHFLLRQPEIRFVSAHHDGQGTADGPFLSAGNRRIQESDAHFLQPVIALSGVRRRDGAVIDDQAALLHVLRHAVFAEVNILYDRSIRKNGQNDIAGTSDLLIGAALRPQCFQFLHQILIQIRYHQVNACLRQMRCHRLSHDAQSDKSYFHVPVLSRDG